MRALHVEGAVRFDTLTYCFNRLYRLVPPYYLALVLGYLAAALLAATGKLRFDHVLLIPSSHLSAIEPWLMLDRDNAPINPGLWTVPLQFRWYALFPIALILWMKAPRAFLLVTALVAASYVGTRARSMDLGTLPLFLLGIVAADLIVRRHALVRSAMLFVPVAVCVAIAWDPHASVPDAWGHDTYFRAQPTSAPWQIAAFLLVIAAVGNDESDAAACTSRSCAAGAGAPLRHQRRSEELHRRGRAEGDIRQRAERRRARPAARRIVRAGSSGVRITVKGSRARFVR